MAKRICRKTVSREGLDRISSLPDDVLVRILSLIPTEQAVITSILSKRWKFSWTLLPHLDLDFLRFSRKFNNDLCLDNRKRKFLDFVEHVCFLRGIEPLRMLRLAFDIVEFEEYISKASMLVKAAMRSDCLSIDLDFATQGEYILFRDEYDKLYTLPSCFFPHPSVTQLKLTGCKFVPSFYKSFASVNIVKFTTVQLHKDSVNDLVTKCPSLQELHLVYCQIPSSVFELIAPESNLKCLVLQSCFANGGLPFKNASIHIPTLLQLKFEGSFESGYLSILDAENLTEAEINIMYGPPGELKFLCKLLKDLHNVKSLTLSSHNLEVLSTNGGIGLLTPFNNLKRLSVRLEHADRELLGLMCLLRSCPCVETLSVNIRSAIILETKDELISSVYEDVLEPNLLPSVCVANLIKIKIENFRGLKAEMEFVNRILMGSLCLKEMIICIHSTYLYLKKTLGKDHSKTLKKKKADTIERLLACTRASPGAKILLQ